MAAGMWIVCHVYVFVWSIGADFSFLFFLGQKDELPPLVYPFLLFPPLPFPLEVSPLNTARGSVVSAVSFCSEVWTEAPADKRCGAYWSQKVQLWWQQFLLIFLRTNVIFRTQKLA